MARSTICLSPKSRGRNAPCCACRQRRNAWQPSLPDPRSINPGAYHNTQRVTDETSTTRARFTNTHTHDQHQHLDTTPLLQECRSVRSAAHCECTGRVARCTWSKGSTQDCFEFGEAPGRRRAPGKPRSPSCGHARLQQPTQLSGAFPMTLLASRSVIVDGEKLKMPPPLPRNGTVFAVTVALLRRVTVAFCALMMPPPWPARLPVTRTESLSVRWAGPAKPMLASPPPNPPEALLAMVTLPLSVVVAVPPWNEMLKMPPPSATNGVVRGDELPVTAAESLTV